MDTQTTTVRVKDTRRHPVRNALGGVADIACAFGTVAKMANIHLEAELIEQSIELCAEMVDTYGVTPLDAASALGVRAEHLSYVVNSLSKRSESAGGAE